MRLFGAGGNAFQPVQINLFNHKHLCFFFFFQDMTSSHSFGSIIFKLKTAFKSQGFQSTFRVKVSVGHAAQTEEPVYVSLGVIT